MIALGIAIIGVIATLAIVFALRKPGGCLRYPFLCGALYLAWIVPQVAALGADPLTPEDGLFWLLVMIVLCLGASLVGWRLSTRPKQRWAPHCPSAGTDGGLPALLWPVAGLTAFMVVLHFSIGLQPIEAREQSQWSGPLTIIAFFLSLSVISLYLSLLLLLREKSLRTLVFASVNVLLSGGTAFVSLRRGVMVDFGIAAASALWFGARRTVPVWLLATGFLGMVLIAYAIGPLRSAASEVTERTGSSVGLLSPEVWQQVDFAAEIQRSSQRAVDLANAAHLIDITHRWGEYTYGRQSWDAFVFRWVPAQILGRDFKHSLMFEQGMDYELIEANYGYDRTGGTTSTGFGFAYQEFGPFGFVYFLLIGIVMGRLWSSAESGSVWAQALYVAFAGNALHSATHHAMWLIVQIPLFLLAVLLLRWAAAGMSARHGRQVGGTTAFGR